MLDEIQDLLQLQDSFVIAACACDTLQIVMITKNQTKKVVKLSKNRQLVTIRLLPQSIKKTVHSCTNVHIFRCEVMVDQDFLMNDLLHVSDADGIIFEKSVSVKDDTLIDTILRNSTVEDSTMHKNDIPGSGGETFFV